MGWKLFKAGKFLVTGVVVFLGLSGTHAVVAETITDNQNQIQATQQSGWQNVGGDTWYYSSGNPVKGQQLIDGKWYLFDKSDGHMLRGLQNLVSYGENKTVYYSQDGSMLYGKIELNGKVLTFLQGTGALQVGWQIGSSANLNNPDGSKTTNKYYVTSDGVVSGEKFIDNRWYLFDETGSMITGKVKLSDYGVSSGKMVLYGPDGSMRYGQQYYNNHWYLFKNGTGEMLTGLQNLKQYGEEKVVYYNPDSGVMQYGRVNVNGVNLFFRTQRGHCSLVG